MAADTEERGADPGAQDAERHACPECGEEFSAKFRLGLHRSQKHGYVSPRRGEDRGRGGKRGPGRPKGSGAGQSRQVRRKTAIKQTIDEILDFADDLRGRSTGELGDLADVLRRDADRIATSLSWAAERFNPLAFGIDKLAGHGGILTLAGGFSGVGRWVIKRWRSLVAERAEAEAEQASWLAAEEVPPEPEQEPGYAPLEHNPVFDLPAE